jgi:hypothetical protein
MKLYTEEQLKEFFKEHYFLMEKDLDNLISIELPSDEEIYKNSFKLDVIYWHDGFLAGVDWLINYIKQQDNGN